MLTQGEGLRLVTMVTDLPTLVIIIVAVVVIGHVCYMLAIFQCETSAPPLDSKMTRHEKYLFQDGEGMELCFDIRYPSN